MMTKEHLVTRVERLRETRASLEDPLARQMLLCLIEAMEEVVEESAQIDSQLEEGPSVGVLV
ncbi:MAG: hypothetical protein JWL84_5537 [Rhodospirillales bacterium]|jgi:hypothetical protein|nr:hypothetical protein [Rhodospirillales bacterium]